MQLRVKIAKQQAAKEQKLRKKNLTKYIPNAAYAIYRVLQSMCETAAVSLTATKLCKRLTNTAQALHDTMRWQFFFNYEECLRELVSTGELSLHLH